ncbi:hypothetical protein PA598K_05873 [Paenibacillus sp. 598K]|uniref:hypothetical protein n=1 Tax=Paenibacillus sp. 598K TaxID=1117987 RepID=UPI000FFA847A|nr:hypothetical protein [Paenibacillus sp. 598K]GBF77329.1 hypothetical protein PA598K_05873 [Paenibacillus sp. 598K]
MQKPWIFETDSFGFHFCRSVLVELISRFPLTQAEGIQLINSRWGHTSFVNEDDIAYHEFPEFWAKEFYWGSNSVWWKSEEERLFMGLEPLKPLRNDKEACYELWETANTEEYVLADCEEIKELFGNDLLNHTFKKTWRLKKKNYNEALTEFYKHRGWLEYREIW